MESVGENHMMRTPIIYYTLKSHCVLFVTMLCLLYTVLQANNSVRNFSAMNPEKIKQKPHRTGANQHYNVSKKYWNRKEDKDSTMMLAM